MDLNIIDTHSHLYAEEFTDDIKETVERALNAGVKQILLPNIDQSTIDGMKDLCKTWPDVFKPMMGLHPSSVKKETYKAELERVKQELFMHSFIAVGEIGMDLYWDKSTQPEQQEAFETQCKWASELDLPIAIHSRNATMEVISSIEKLQIDNLTGVFHCSEANKIIDLGFKLGIGGVLTFKNSGLAEVLSEIDLEHLILETDSPYLAPAPYRGKRNESAYTALVAQKLADVKHTTLEKVAEITTQNAQELFRI